MFGFIYFMFLNYMFFSDNPRQTDLSFHPGPKLSLLSPHPWPFLKTRQKCEGDLQAPCTLEGNLTSTWCSETWLVPTSAWTRTRFEQGLDITYTGTSSKVDSVDRHLVRERDNSTLGSLPPDTPSAPQNPGADQILLYILFHLFYFSQLCAH
jgi:hypothetical protein